ncbi:hypothetical protein [Bacillus cereus group sp. BfR-BA-01319]|uniref:hypothetical protein n=1 Tax=Bacillus cereus group sp. BfR-BA-01319 TaxID=2920296 RepID=UPI001F5798A1
MSWNNDIFSDFLTLIFLAWFFSEMLAVPHKENNFEKASYYFFASHKANEEVFKKEALK